MLAKSEFWIKIGQIICGAYYDNLCSIHTYINCLNTAKIIKKRYRCHFIENAVIVIIILYKPLL